MGSHKSCRLTGAVHLDRGSLMIISMGALLGLAGVAVVSVTPESLSVLAVEYSLIVLPASALVYFGYRLATSEFSNEERLTVAKWCLGGSLAVGVLILGEVLSDSPRNLAEPSEHLLLGMLGGSLITMVPAIMTSQSSSVVRQLNVQEGPDMTAPAVDLSPEAEELASLVSSQKDWYIVRTLVLADEPMTVGTLASRLAQLEDANATTVDAHLHQVNLQRLTEKGIVSYNPATGLITLGEDFDEIAASKDELSAAISAVDEAHA